MFYFHLVSNGCLVNLVLLMKNLFDLIPSYKGILMYITGEYIKLTEYQLAELFYVFTFDSTSRNLGVVYEGKTQPDCFISSCFKLLILYLVFG